MRLRGRAMNDGLLAHLSIQSVLVIIVSQCLISLVILTRIFISELMHIVNMNLRI